MNRALLHAAVVAGLAASTAATLGKDLEIGGIGGDDASVAYSALAMLKPGIADFEGSIYHLKAFAWNIPLTHNFYQGPGAIYAVAPFVAVVDDRAKAVRWFTLSCAALLVAAVYGLAFVLSSSVALSLLCGLTLATSPYLATQIKHGFSQTGLTNAPLSCAALMFLLLACRNRSRGAWLLSCAASGLSLGFAPQAAAPFAAWGLSVLLLRERLRPAWRSHRHWVLGCSLALLGTGVAPMLLANALHNGFGVDGIVRNFRVTEFGVNNAHYGQNILLRLSHLRYLFGAGPEYPGNMTPTFYFPVFVTLCCALSVFGALRGRRANDARHLNLLPMLYIPVIFLLSPLTLFHFDPYHIVILLPLGLAAAAALPGIASSVPYVRTAVLLGLVVGLLVQGAQLAQFWRSPAVRGEFPTRTHGAYLIPLAQWLLAQPGDRVSLCTPLGSHELSYLLAGKMFVHEYFNDPSTPWTDRLRELETIVRAGAAGYIVSERFRGTEPQAMGEIRRLAAKYGLTPAPLKKFDRPGGGAAYEIYTLLPRPQAARRSPAWIPKKVTR